MKIEKREGEYLQYYRVNDLIKNAFSHSNMLTASKLRNKLRYNFRPSNFEWASYLADLIFDNDLLKIVKLDKKVEFYELNN